MGMVKSGRRGSGGDTYHSILGDCFLWTRAKVDKKYMILTDEEIMIIFRVDVKQSWMKLN